MKGHEEQENERKLAASMEPPSSSNSGECQGLSGDGLPDSPISETKQEEDDEPQSKKTTGSPDINHMKEEKPQSSNTAGSPDINHMKEETPQSSNTAGSPDINHMEEEKPQSSNTAGSPDINNTKEENTVPPADDTTGSKPEPIMCRNFVRGTCKRGSACKFMHELVLTQIPGVYTFCRNFQNKECKHSKCMLIHATVSEKEHYFRTGYLPPHTTAHMERNADTSPPPPKKQCN